MQTDTDQIPRLRTLTLISVLAALISLSAGCSDQQPTAPAQTQPAEAPATQQAEPEPEPEPTPPAAEPEAAAAAGGAVASAVDGESVYKKACISCHAAGIANAPKLGDAAAWAPRIAKGKEAMFESVNKGLNAMPPRGACASCSDEELRSAMEYMIAQGS